jgi:segregation and condensation protein A
MDLLLDLARRQKLDLGPISILSLVEQFLAVIEGAERVRLELAADWLVMAAWLTWLKSRLLLPPAEDDGEAELAAETLASRLQELEAIRAAAAWLADRPQLGRDVFARGAPERLVAADRSRLAADLPGLLRGYLGAVRRLARQRTYRPGRTVLWSVQDAMDRLAAMLGQQVGWIALDRFLPPLLMERPLTDPLARRAALASTLLAGLEMARGGAAELRQDQPFSSILLRGRT